MHGRKRVLLVVVGVMALLSTAGPGMAQAAKPSANPTFEFDRTSTSSRCSNLGYYTADPSDDRDTPDGGARCDAREATATAATSTLATDTAASTTTATDPIGAAAPGQGAATAQASIYFKAKLPGKPSSKVEISVPIDSIESSATATPTSSAYSLLRVYAWTYNPYTYDGGWELMSQAPLPMSAPSAEPRTVELELAASKLRGEVRLLVSVYSVSQIGTVSCRDDDGDGYCDPGTMTTRDGFGSAAAQARVRVGLPTLTAS